ncbi:MAG: cupin domain-containing protein [Alphaproteobacteria bacterium]|nr:cupin domain-containing protein [Alphaproteobacteria bacterium]
MPSTMTKLITGEALEVLRFDYGPEDHNPAHCHGHEQTGYVESGRFRLTVEGEAREYAAGSAYVVPAEAEHTFDVLESGVVIVSTSPKQTTYTRAQ